METYRLFLKSVMKNDLLFLKTEIAMKYDRLFWKSTWTNIWYYHIYFLYCSNVI